MAYPETQAGGRVLPSAGQAATDAWAWMRHVLFEPFDLGKWFALGFCAFLAELGSGGGGSSFNLGSSGDDGGLHVPDARAVFNFIGEHLAAIVIIGSIVFVVVCAIVVLFAWLQSRGTFMFLDGVATNQGRVTTPWRVFSREANSLLVFRLVVVVAFFAGMGILGGGGAAIAWPYFSRGVGGTFTPILTIIVAGVLLCAWVLAVGLLSTVVTDFCVPIMYRYRVSVVHALQIVRDMLLPGRIGAFIVFYLLKIVMAVAGGMVIFALVCLTCCLCCTMMIPFVGGYIAAVVFLPYYVFFRAYSLCFLAQCDGAWEIRPAMAHGMGRAASGGEDA